MSLGLPVVVCGETSRRKAFRVEAATVAFNAHGALLILHEKVETGQMLLLMNPTTWDDQEARVVYSTSSRGGTQYVGVEFIQPAPLFWGVKDPPRDWIHTESTPTNALSRLFN
jgi:hypothetical protein